MYSFKTFLHLPHEVFLQELYEDKNAVVIDVRTAEEYRKQYLPGSVNIDFMSPAFLDRIRELDKSKTYFLVCETGEKSARTGDIMKQLGFKVRNLIGGLQQWPGNNKAA